MKELEKPDKERCQALKGNGVHPFTLGGAPKYIRCDNKPIVIIHENKVAEDGQKGSMSLCKDCLEVAKKELGEDFFTIEEIVEKDYEILSYQYKDKTIELAINCATEISKSGYWNIYSVKRLSDGEVFTVGDRVKEYITGGCRGWAISEFSLKNTRCFTAGVNINNIEEVKQPILRTEDGVDIFEGDKYFTVRDKDFSISCDGNGFKSKGKHFSTKEAAEEYILMNKPCLSVNDVKNSYSGLFNAYKNHTINNLTKLVKSRLNNF